MIKTDEELRKELSDMFEHDMGLIPGSVLIDGQHKLDTASGAVLDMIAGRYGKTRQKVIVPFDVPAPEGSEFQREFKNEWSCTHKWVTYRGFTEEYQYCEHCPERRPIQ